MLSLHLLGRLELLDDSGVVDAASIRGSKRPALLCLLAAAGSGGFRRRDELLAMLWPEAPDTKARAALRSTIHALRSDLGKGVIRNRGRSEIGIDPHHLETDLGAFLEAWERGDPAVVLEVYGGTLLPGFHVDDAEPFMEWLDEFRASLQRRALAAATRAAETAASQGRVHDAVAVARRAVELDPYDEAAHQRLIGFLTDAGDHGGALAVYRRFADRLRDEFDAGPAKETTDLVAGLAQASSEVEPPVPIKFAPAARPETVSDAGAEWAAAVEPVAAAPPGGALRQTARRRRWAAAAAVVLVLAASWTAYRTTTEGTAEAITPDASGALPVAVFPFTVIGEADRVLVDGFPRLLSDRLDIPGALRAIDVRATNERVREDSTLLGDPVRAAQAARELGAGAFVLGTVVGSEGTYRVTVDVYREGADAPGRLDVDLTSESDIFGAVDRLTTHVVSLLGPPGGELGRAAAVSAPSIPALRAYLLGERAFQEGRFTEAVDAFTAAVAADSSFALGYYGLARAAEWTAQDSLIQLGTREASLRAEELPDRFRLLVEAKRSFWANDLREAARLYRTILTRYPDDVEARYELADLTFHDGPLEGIPIAEAEDGFRAVVAVTPDYLSARLHLVRLLSLRGEVAGAEEWAAPLVGRGVGPPQAEVLGLRAAWHGDTVTQEAAVAYLRTLPPSGLVGTLWRIAEFAPRPDAALPLIDAAVEPSMPTDVRALAQALRVQIEAASGRLDDALASTERASGLDPWTGWTAQALLAAVPEYEAAHPMSADLVRRGRALLETRPPIPTPTPVSSLASAEFRLSILALLAAREGDTTTTTQVLRRLDVLPADRRPPIHDLVEATAAEQSQGAQAALDRLVSPTRGPAYRSAIRWALPLWAGALTEEVGRPEESVSWYRAVDQDQIPSLAARPIARLREARALRKLGRSEEARAAYQDFLKLWRQPDPALAPLRDAALEEVAALR